MPKQNMFLINDIDFILKVYELGKKHGKKPGDSCKEEFEEMLKIDPGAVTFLGNTEKDIDMVAGDMREQGTKVVNIAEINRKSKEV